MPDQSRDKETFYIALVKAQLFNTFAWAGNRSEVYTRDIGALRQQDYRNIYPYIGEKYTDDKKPI